IVFDLGEKIGCRFTPSSVFVDLYIDGDYCGVYQLAEKCEIGSSRVDVSDPYAVLLELDVRERLDASDIYFTLPISGKAVVFKDYVTDFEETTDAEVIKQAREVRAHIKNQLILFESVLYSKDAPWSEIESRIDVDSFIRYFFISEFTEEVDATFASTFFYIDGKDDVIHCDPLWDYDRCLGFGTEYSRDTREDFLKNISVITDELRAEWFKQLFRYPEFARRVNGMYDSCIKEALDSDAICGAVDRYLSELHDSLMMNFTRYTDIFVGLDDPAKNHFNGESDVTIERQIGYAANEMKRWIRERAEFTESAFGGDMPILRYSAASSDGTLGKSYTGGFTEGTSNVGGMKLELLRSGVGGGIEYSIAYAGKTYGPASDGEELIGGYDRITGISVKLTGAAAKFYSVEYRALLPSGRTGEWARDGGIAGAVNGSFSRFGVKAFEVRLIKKIIAAAGDADGDGALTMKDVLMIRRSIAGIGTIPDGRADICDVDGDGDVTMKDVLMLRRSIAGLL
ncbi:MAG: CotH kinase family protein, partial [Clostridia bacterium]|nr:CotH kinase family protein [Clostridia bacterium]